MAKRLAVLPLCCQPSLPATQPPVLVPKLGSSLVSSRQYSRDELGVGISASICHRVQRESLILLPCGCEGAVEAMVHYNHPGALKGSPKEDIFLRILYPKPLNPPQGAGAHSPF